MSDASLRAAGGRALAAAALAAAALAIACAGSAQASRRRDARPPRAVPASTGEAVALWPQPAVAPAGWRTATLPDGAASLRFPPGWRVIAGDRGSVSAALLGGHGAFEGYLNVTPREGSERARGWPAFRLSGNREEGDRDVREVAAAEGVAFAGARGSCVIDSYRSHVGGHAYRELACLVTGARATSVFIGATALGEWTALAPVIERAAGAFVER